MSKLLLDAPHFLFVVLGTGGDVWPALELAVAARDAGAEVDVAVYAQFEPEVRARRLRFHAIGSTEEYQATVHHPVYWSRMGAQLAMSEGGFLHVAITRVLALVDSLRERRPILVCTRTAFGARFAAELHGLTCISLTYSPQQLITPERMPYPFNRGFFGMLPHWYWRIGLPVGDRLGLDKLLPTLNRLRQSLGLPPIDRLRDWLFFGTPSLALYPAWFDDLGSLAAAGIRQGDFILRHVDESDVSDESLIRFLDAGAPPVVCTLGTGIAHAGERYAQVARTLTRMGRRGVFVTPIDKNIQTELGPHVMRVGYANLAALLRRSSLLIHHGGVGTVSQALRAATPQLIMPFYYDQSDNGDRVRKLGAGRMLEARVPEADALAQAIEYCSTLDKALLDSLRARAFSGGGARTCYRALQELLLQAGATSECQWQATEQEVRS